MAIKNTFSTIFPVFLAALLCAVMAACAPMKATRGNFIDDDQLKTLQIGVSTKDEVQQKLGTPTTTDPFDPNTWFYIGEKTSEEAFFMPNVDSRKVIVMKFDANNMLASANQVDEKAGKQVEVVKKETPAPGKEMNAFQQFIGNLGKFNGSSGGTPGQGH